MELNIQTPLHEDIPQGRVHWLALVLFHTPKPHTSHSENLIVGTWHLTNIPVPSNMAAWNDQRYPGISGDKRHVSALQNLDAEHRDRIVIYFILGHNCSASFYNSIRIIRLLVVLFRLTAEWKTNIFSHPLKHRWICLIGHSTSLSTAYLQKYQLLMLQARGVRFWHG